MGDVLHLRDADWLHFIFRNGDVEKCTEKEYYGCEIPRLINEGDNEYQKRIGFHMGHEIEGTASIWSNYNGVYLVNLDFADCEPGIRVEGHLELIRVIKRWVLPYAEFNRLTGGDE